MVAHVPERQAMAGLMRALATLALAVTCVFGVAACWNGHASQGGMGDTAMPALPTLSGAIYRMTRFQGEALSDKTHYLIRFGRKRLSGRICNTFAGPYRIERGRLSARLVSTKMYCTGQGVMKVESALLKALATGVTLQRSGQQLQLSGEAGKPLFQFHFVGRQEPGEGNNVPPQRNQ